MSEHNPVIVLSSTVGSHAYGLNHEGSDYDIKHVAIPELKHYFGCSSTWSGTSSTRTQNDRKEEHTTYEITRFVSQCLNASPESLDILFTPLARPTHRIGFDLLSIRQEFLSKKVRHSYSGFAFSQLKKLRDKPSDPHAGKWASHAHRLITMAYEILSSGRVNVDRSSIDRELHIRLKTKWEPNMLDFIDEYVSRIDSRLDELYKDSSLPHAPNKKEIDEWLTSILKTHFLL